jgi:hypothetical protein
MLLKSAFLNIHDEGFHSEDSAVFNELNEDIIAENLKTKLDVFTINSALDQIRTQLLPSTLSYLQDVLKSLDQQNLLDNGEEFLHELCKVAWAIEHEQLLQSSTSGSSASSHEIQITIPFILSTYGSATESQDSSTLSPQSQRNYQATTGADLQLLEEISSLYKKILWLRHSLYEEINHYISHSLMQNIRNDVSKWNDHLQEGKDLDATDDISVNHSSNGDDDGASDKYTERSNVNENGRKVIYKHNDIWKKVHDGGDNNLALSTQGQVVRKKSSISVS